MSTPTTELDRLGTDFPKEAHSQLFKSDLAKADIQRFSELHSWYKHLPREEGLQQGEAFYAIPMVGQQQERNGLDSSSQKTSTHWHFWTAEQLARNQHLIGSSRLITALSYPVYLDNSFGQSGGGGAEKLLYACEQIWARLAFTATA